MKIHYTGYAKFKSKPLRFLYSFPWFAMGSSWALQGLLYMDPTERYFKLGLDLLATLLIGGLLAPLKLPLLRWGLAFFIAHSFNFLFIGQLWGGLKCFGYVYNGYERYIAYMNGLAARAKSEPSIHKALVFGSFAREQWTPHSDLDVRLLRKPGLINGLRACVFLLSERTRAFFAGFPLDAYVLDSEVPLGRLREQGVLLFNDEDDQAPSIASNTAL